MHFINTATFLLAIVLPVAFTAPIPFSSSESTLQVRDGSDVDCTKLTRGDGGKFIVSGPSGPVIDKCFKFTNLGNSLGPSLADINNGEKPLPPFDCNAVQNPASDGTFTIDANGLNLFTMNLNLGACIQDPSKDNKSR
ncbi:hypothetical protein K474DRAFT_1711630 [Panus rudis PR-1116 ss-1]|nr:hypothetical protein K474DRAFT_1711630 [Panus rudis PR-1116 ss-1]